MSNYKTTHPAPQIKPEIEPEIQQIFDEADIVIEAEVIPKTFMVKVNTFLNLRQEPTVESAIIRVLNPGETMEAYEECGDWIRLKDGFVMSQYIEKI